jgi:hypothetical protein
MSPLSFKGVQYLQGVGGQYALSLSRTPQTRLTLSSLCCLCVCEKNHQGDRVQNAFAYPTHVASDKKILLV